MTDLTGDKILRRKRAQADFAKSQESARAEFDRVIRRAARTKRKLKDSASGKPTPGMRRDPDLDSLIFKRIRAAVDEGLVVRLTGTPGPTVTDLRIHKQRKPNAINKPDGSISHIETTFLVPHWDHTGNKLKALSWAIALSQRGGVAMSLHLSDAVIEKAQKSSLGFAAYMRERITKGFRDRGPGLFIRPPEFFFMIEAGSGVDPHIHGGIVIPEQVGGRALVEQVLMAAGGTWKGQKRQLDLREITDPSGWVRYISKWQLTTTMLLGDARVGAASSSLRARAQAWYRGVRSRGGSIS